MIGLLWILGLLACGAGAAWLVTWLRYGGSPRSGVAGMLSLMIGLGVCGYAVILEIWQRQKARGDHLRPGEDPYADQEEDPHLRAKLDDVFGRMRPQDRDAGDTET